MGRVDHLRVGITALIGQFQQHPGKSAFLAPSLPATVKGLWRPEFGRSITPALSIAIGEDNPAQHALIIDTWLAMAFWEERLKLRHLRIVQPIQIRHIIVPFRADVNHAAA